MELYNLYDPDIETYKDHFAIMPKFEEDNPADDGVVEFNSLARTGRLIVTSSPTVDGEDGQVLLDFTEPAFSVGSYRQGHWYCAEVTFKNLKCVPGVTEVAAEDQSSKINMYRSQFRVGLRSNDGLISVTLRPYLRYTGTESIYRTGLYLTYDGTGADWDYKRANFDIATPKDVALRYTATDAFVVVNGAVMPDLYDLAQTSLHTPDLRNIKLHPFVWVRSIDGHQTTVSFDGIEVKLFGNSYITRNKM